MEKGKISALQMLLMLYPTIIATGILSVPSITARYAHNDFWFSPIIASVVGFMTVYIAVQLQKAYPEQTVTEYSTKIIGRIPGKVFGLLLLFFYTESTGDITRMYSMFISNSFLPQTPEIVIIATMVLVCAFCVYGGLEVIARVGQIIFPLFVLPIVMLAIFLTPDFKPYNILPMFEKGVLPSLKGAITPAGWFAEFFMMTFLLPYLADQKKGMKNGMLSVIGVMITLVVVNLIVLFILGTMTANKVYPLMNVARYANIAGFFENLETFVMGVWIAGVFLKTTVFFYVATLSTAQWLNLSDYRPIIWPLAILIVVFAFWGVPSSMEMTHYNVTGFPFYSIFVQFIVPLFLLIIATLKNKLRKK